jgi:hypothetical protein
MTELAIIALIAAGAGTLGVVVGRWLAPRIDRLTGDEEEDGPDDGKR